MRARIATALEDFDLQPSFNGSWRGKYWELCQNLVFFVDDTKHVIPKGFDTDGLSVPVLYRWRFERLGQGVRAGVVHDWIYANPYVDIDRKTADRIFRQLLINDGVSKWSANVMYVAVRIGGRSHYQKRIKS